MKKIVKAQLSKLKFSIGLTPEIEGNSDKKKLFIPEKYKSVLLISADFELAWAWQFAKYSADPLALSIDKARLERKNIPQIVKLCEKYNIPITWATVGHLFLESCDKRHGFAHNDLPRLKHFENDFWKFDKPDWFINDPCTDFKISPEWYCPDLIQQILNSPVKHEIGNHSFSHIDCRDGVCPPELLKAELRESKKLAAGLGLDLKSFVHPGHTIGNLDVLAEEGFTNFRTDYRNVLGYPKKHQNGLWELEQTAEFNFRKEWSINYHIYRYKTILKRAIKSNTVAVFWFHPSFETVMIDKIWPEVFRFLDDNRDKIWVTTHNEYINWLNEKRG
jgi:peptidoglycan/xylan/chitin deacetylase (PgdA/CDA1 family)